MPRKLTILAAAMIVSSVTASVAEAAFVKRTTLRPRDAEPSVRAAITDLSSGDLAVDDIEGIHHPRTSGKAAAQANTATVYARVSGDLTTPIPGQPDLQLDEDILTLHCEQLEDRRWICSSPFLAALLSSGSLLPEYFFLEK